MLWPFYLLQNHGLTVRACHTRTGADRISGLSTGWYTMGQAVGWWSFIIWDGIFFYGWLKFIEGCKSTFVEICFFFKTWMSSKENFNPQRLGLFALTELRNTCTCPEKVPKQLWVLYHPLSTELVDQLIQIVSNSQWWSGILKTSPAN